MQPPNHDFPPLGAEPSTAGGSRGRSVTMASGASDGAPEAPSALGDWTGADADAMAELLGITEFDADGACPLHF